MYESMKEHKTAKPFRQTLRLTHKVAHFFGEKKRMKVYKSVLNHCKA